MILNPETSLLGRLRLCAALDAQDALARVPRNEQDLQDALVRVRAGEPGILATSRQLDRLRNSIVDAIEMQNNAQEPMLGEDIRFQLATLDFVRRTFLRELGQLPSDRSGRANFLNGCSAMLKALPSALSDAFAAAASARRQAPNTVAASST